MFNRTKSYFVAFTGLRHSSNERVFGNCVVEATPIKSIGHIHAIEDMIELNDDEIHSVRVTYWKRFE